MHMFTRYWLAEDSEAECMVSAPLPIDNTARFVKAGAGPSGAHSPKATAAKPRGRPPKQVAIKPGGAAAVDAAAPVEGAANEAAPAKKRRKAGRKVSESSAVRVHAHTDAGMLIFRGHAARDAIKRAHKGQSFLMHLSKFILGARTIPHGIEEMASQTHIICLSPGRIRVSTSNAFYSLRDC